MTEPSLEIVMCVAVSDRDETDITSWSARDDTPSSLSFFTATVLGARVGFDALFAARGWLGLGCDDPG